MGDFYTELTWITAFPVNIFSTTNINFQFIKLFGPHAFFAITLVRFILEHNISYEVEIFEDLISEFPRDIGIFNSDSYDGQFDLFHDLPFDIELRYLPIRY